MTAAATEHARLAVAADGALTVAAVVSVGLSNTVCAGVTPPAAPLPGTINAILLLDADLTPAAMVNAVITATEGKTMALGEWQVSDARGAPASGTSTDAVVVACTGRGAALDYAGPGTHARLSRGPRRARGDRPHLPREARPRRPPTRLVEPGTSAGAPRAAGRLRRRCARPRRPG